MAVCKVLIAEGTLEILPLEFTFIDINFGPKVKTEETKKRLVLPSGL